MTKQLSKATPISIIINIILIINVCIVLYPVLFTVSSSFTKSNSLAATSVIPFTDQKDLSQTDCMICYGTGHKVDTSKRVKFGSLEPSMKETFANMTKSSVFPVLNTEIDGVAATVAPTDLFVADAIKESVALKNNDADSKRVVIATYSEELCDSCNGTGKLLCYSCKGTGTKKIKVKSYFIDENGKKRAYFGEKILDCTVCEGKGQVEKLRTAFKFKKPSLYQYQRLLTNPDKLVKGETSVHGTNYKNWYLNTLKIACMNTILTVFICTTTGYIFSRFEFAGRKQIMAGMIVLQMFPSFIGMVATYVILWKFNALNTLWGLVLVYASGSIPFNGQLMKGYFDTMPKDIAEAAYIDGASPLVAYLRVILPAAKPQIVFLTLTSFTGPWMDYIFPRMVLRSDDKKTLAVGLYEMISGRSNDNFTMFAAGAILVAVPFTILFMAGQKTLLLSLAGTSGKE